MKFIRRLPLDKNFNPTRYFYKHTYSFRRLSGTPTKMVGLDYYLWEFSSRKIPNGCAAIPKETVDHMLVFELNGNDSVAILPFRFNRFMETHRFEDDIEGNVINNYY